MPGTFASIPKNQIPGRLIFVINPISGGFDKSGIVGLIKKSFPGLPEDAFLFTNAKDSPARLTDMIKTRAVDTVAVVGGDGTVNRIAGQMLYSNIRLAIIPSGSGNGLARELGLPSDASDALQVIKSGRERVIDCGLANDAPFFCTAGAGFDAHVSGLFSGSKKRGFYNYCRITLSQVFGYRPQTYKILVNGNELVRESYMVTIANGSQFGNNAYIAPQAELDDGLLDVCLIKPFPWQYLAGLIWRLFHRSIHLSRYYESFKTREVALTRESPGFFHFDGEPVQFDKEIKIKIQAGALRVLVGI
ncbi:MAG: diacylglycerol kinase family lipid kinase [Bacteroidota bacterium]|nr:diacylglycerol kinase family lipid kinase [Bacteroidota bacterium]